MEHLYLNAKKCSRKQLSVLIRGLEESKTYEGFRIKIAGGDWHNTTIDINKGKDGQTHDVVFNQLQPETVYEFLGEIKINGHWFPLKQTAFVTQTRPGADGMPLPPGKYANRGGAFRRG